MTTPQGPFDPDQPPAGLAGVPAPPPTENPFATGSFGATGPAPTYGTPGPTTGPAGSAPTYGPPGGVPGLAYPAPDQFSSAGGEDLGRAALRSATITFFAGVAIVLVGLGTIIWASGDGGGVLWYGGVVFGGIVLFRGLAGLFGARKAGARLTTGRVAGIAAGAVVCLVAGAVTVLAYVVPGSVTPHIATGLGSCWTAATDGKLTPVDCGSTHDLVGSQVVTDYHSCAESSDGYTDGDDAGTYLCLAKDG
jgi:hypothetical protein